jgi:hypothetical protein
MVDCCLVFDLSAVPLDGYSCSSRRRSVYVLYRLIEGTTPSWWGGDTLLVYRMASETFHWRTTDDRSPYHERQAFGLGR